MSYATLASHTGLSKAGAQRAVALLRRRKLLSMSKSTRHERSRISRGASLGRAHSRMKKSHSSKQWLRRHVNDPFVQRSKKEGYRSRSAYKLTEIDERDKLLKPGMVVVDLGAAPGRLVAGARPSGWATGTVIAIDLLEMEPDPGVTSCKGDFTQRQRARRRSQHALGGRKADLVLSDMAPNMSGIAMSDQARSMELAEIARDFALLHLKPDGRVPGQDLPGGGV